MAAESEETDHPTGVAKVTPAAVTCGVFFGLESCGNKQPGTQILSRTDNHNALALLLIWGDCKANAIAASIDYTAVEERGSQKLTDGSVTCG